MISSNSSLKTEKPEVKKTSISDRNALHGMTAIGAIFYATVGIEPLCLTSINRNFGGFDLIRSDSIAFLLIRI